VASRLAGKAECRGKEDKTKISPSKQNQTNRRDVSSQFLQFLGKAHVFQGLTLNLLRLFVFRGLVIRFPALLLLSFAAVGKTLIILQYL